MPQPAVWHGQLGVASDDHRRYCAGSLRDRAEREITGMAAQCPWDDPVHDAVAMTAEEIEATVADFVAAEVRAELARPSDRAVPRDVPQPPH